MPEYINGIDVSRYQGTHINWDGVLNEGYRFTFIKVTDGSSYNQSYIDGAKIQAHDSGVAGFKIGYYHYSRPGKNSSVEADARSEANYFISKVGEFPKANFPLVLDFEDPNMVLNPVEALNWVHIFAQVIEEAGYGFMIYATKSYLESKLPSSHDLGQYPLWIARYPNTFNIENPPACPIGWQAWDVWQYSEHGVLQSVPGGQFDLNVMTQDFFDKY
ncbi:MAG: glycoside hydrolase family 25 protein [Ignavibacteria bacterium]|nr:glycoside hydrolase family 25 protein [Ignavibacteria bacterium]